MGEAVSESRRLPPLGIRWPPIPTWDELQGMAARPLSSPPPSDDSRHVLLSWTRSDGSVVTAACGQWTPKEIA